MSRGKSRDDLQDAIALVKKGELPPAAAVHQLQGLDGGLPGAGRRGLSSSSICSSNSRASSSCCTPVAGPAKPVWILRTWLVRSMKIAVG